MGHLLRSALVLLVQASMVSWVAAATCDDSVSEAFATYDLVTDVGVSAPCELLELEFTSSGSVVDLGNELTPTAVADESGPSKKGPGHHRFTTLVFVDPDYSEAPEFLHWLVGNIPNGTVTDGEILAEFIRSGPAEDSGLHRYTFYLFEQSDVIDFEETKLTNDSVDGRASFSTQTFAEKYNLGSPVAGNFYRAQYDVSVDELYKQLGLA